MSSAGSRGHLVLVSPVQHISVPETPLVAGDVPHFAPPVVEPWFPDQGAVAEDPQVGLFLEVLSFHGAVGRRREERRTEL